MQSEQKKTRPLRLTDYILFRLLLPKNVI